MDFFCTSDRDTCPCHRHSSLRSFYSEGETDAYGKTYDNTGRKYDYLDHRTLLSEHDKQAVGVFGYVPSKTNW